MELALEPRGFAAQALAAAHEAHRDRLVRRPALVAGVVEEARDLAHDAFLRAAEQDPPIPEPDLARWLTVVGVRLAIDERRRRRRWEFLAIRETDATFREVRAPWACSYAPSTSPGISGVDTDTTYHVDSRLGATRPRANTRRQTDGAGPER